MTKEEKILKQFQDKIILAEKHYQKYEGVCSKIYQMLEPMIDKLNDNYDSNYVFRQAGDGFVLVYNREGVAAPLNTPILSIVKLFFQKGEKLNEDDLQKISI
ncbi:hypothetical protein [Capnocytophaga stomatis]|uniref:hypothetical protein n=1 Tax=Capnocytophaga stomatis TaxID=1848904 RepID=UPI00194ED91A|nr:hypothetical protein [Capnocytophaga stomatis]